ARQLALTANRDLIVPFVEINFGPQERYPLVYWPISENEDIKAISDALEKLVPLGLRVGAQEVRNKIGFSQPTKEEDVLKAPESAPDDERGQKAGEDKQKAHVCADCGGAVDVSVTREGKGGKEQGGKYHDELERLSETALSDWEEDLEPLLEPFKKLVREAKSYEDILKGLDELLGEMDHHALAARLAKVQMIARGLGYHG
ncbi:phage portal protein family protein, partial [Bartonella vinsonii]